MGSFNKQNPKILARRLKHELTKLISLSGEYKIMDKNLYNNINEKVKSFLVEILEDVYNESCIELFDILIDQSKENDNVLIMSPKNFITALWLMGETPPLDVINKVMWSNGIALFRWDDKHKKISTSMYISDIDKVK